MGISKTEHFSAAQNQLASMAKALGHPARIAILDYLHTANACICGDIVEVLPLAQPTVSQHLKELKTAGLIKGSIEGNSICYCIDRAAMAGLIDYLAELASVPAPQDGNSAGGCC